MSSQAIYGHLGQISITFATIEHKLLDLLDYLLTNDKLTLVSPYVLERLPLSARIETIRSVAEVRLWDYKDLSAELKKVLDDIDGLRTERNLFIHGDWLTSDLQENATSVTVLDFKPRFDKNTGVWTYMETKRVSDTKLNAMLIRVKKASQELKAVSEKVRAVKLRGSSD